MPTAWKNRYYSRAGESLVPLPQTKIDIIRRQERLDWSRQIAEGAGIEHLDSEAIALAREKYLEKTNRPHIAEELAGMSDEQFLTKIKLMIDGKVTNAAIYAHSVRPSRAASGNGLPAGSGAEGSGNL
ncbi:MAG: hypothetical protein LUI39_13490 [Lachnospiraceae bacterium]|nr:hypothetical protein [Lachnospiraceae bacterium]